MGKLTAYTSFDIDDIFDSEYEYFVLDRDSDYLSFSKFTDDGEYEYFSYFSGTALDLMSTPQTGTVTNGIGTIGEDSEDYWEFEGSMAANAFTSAYFDEDDAVAYDFMFAGNDTIVGSSGNDNLFMYGAGNDSISAGGGNDFVGTVVEGTSTVDGGDGNDFLCSYGTNDSITTGLGSDVVGIFASKEGVSIKDFSINSDMIEVTLYSSQAAAADDMSAFEWDGISLIGPDDTNVYVKKGAKKVKDADDHFAYDLKTGKLYFDVDGKGGSAAVEIATFTNKPQFTAATLADSIQIGIIGSDTYNGEFEHFIENNSMGSL